MSQGLVDCLVGLQWGSEGKGKIAGYLAKEYNGMVRSGGPQAGHTFYIGEEKCINRQIPCGVHNPNCKLYLSANSIINIEVLLDEIKRYELTPKHLMIDNNALLVTPEHIRLEAASSLGKRLASTLEGVGAAQSEKVWRRAKLFGNNSTRSHRDCLVYDKPELYFFAGDTSESIHQQIADNAPVLLEGTQGFGLCLNHGDYPYVTSRDINSSSLLSDAGISPRFHGQTIGVMRTYPIRVGGNSGPVGSDELSWKEITKRSRSKTQILEHTTVTGRVRRVFEQDWVSISKAIEINQPDQIALCFLDYINAEDYGKNDLDKLSDESRKYIEITEELVGAPITLISTGPKNEHMIDIRHIDRKRTPIKNIHILDNFPDNFIGYDWNSGYFEEFIKRKMCKTA